MSSPSTSPGDPADDSLNEALQAGVPDDAQGETAAEMLPPEPATLVAIVGGFAAVLLLSIAMLLPVPYIVLKPGPVLNTLGAAADGKELITISGHASYPADGQLDLTTVSSLGGPGRRVSLIQVATSWLSGDSTVVPEKVYYPPGQTEEQSKQIDEADMVNSQESASVAALTALGYTVPADLAIFAIRPTAPAAKVFKSGDVIRTVDGRNITSLAALRSALAKVPGGDSVKVQVLRDGKVLPLTTRTSTDKKTRRTVLDIFVDQRFKLPFTIKIQIEDIGGPSAGQMFALGVIDKLTPGDITGGKRIAGTGTIDSSGTIGPIGGIRQKLIGARDAGAQYFLAPARNCAEVVGHVPDGLRVVPTATLTQSRGEVAKIAGGDLAGLPTCS